MRTSPLVSILGPTACGKTAVAVGVARAIGGAILSADSRQLYRGMDIGTGKDLEEYAHPEHGAIAHYLIDVADAGERWSLYTYLEAFYKAHADAAAKGYRPILCGGTGLYAEAVIRGYHLPAVPEDAALREELAPCTMEELTARLASLQTLHNTTDTESRKRLVRAIEIGPTFAIAPTREARRARISARLDARLAQGLVEEVRGLVARGVQHDTLQYYGLEYRYVSLHLLGKLTWEEMRNGLETAIHQFAKRQMTYLRGMERRGTQLIWLDGDKSTETLIQTIVESLRREHGV